MKVLVLSKYDKLAASPRYRFLAYEPSLQAAGIDLTLSPLFDDEYLAQKFDSGSTSTTGVIRAYGRRVRALLGSQKWDLLWIHCELFPYLPPWTEHLLRFAGVPYVFDYDDAIFHMYDQHSRPIVRKLLGNKIAPIIRGAKAVTAGSQYLANYASQYNSEVHVIPTVIDLDLYTTKQDRGNQPFTAGWIGSPSTSVYLDLVAPALQRLAEEGPVRLILVGAPPRTIPGVDIDVRAWSSEREVADLLECNVGLMPLPDEPWARGKCAFKLIQYMACGLPTISSPVGANCEVVDTETGLLPTTTDEWLDALRTLRDDPDLRKTLGDAGRARVQARYSLQSQQQHVCDILSAAASR